MKVEKIKKTKNHTISFTLSSETSVVLDCGSAFIFFPYLNKQSKYDCVDEDDRGIIDG